MIYFPRVGWFYRFGGVLCGPYPTIRTALIFAMVRYEISKEFV